MSRITVSLPDEQQEWVDQTAEKHELSKSKVIRECVKTAMGKETLLRRTGNQESQLAERVDTLEEQVRNLESTLAKAPANEQESPETRKKAAPEASDAGPKPNDPSEREKESESQTKESTPLSRITQPTDASVPTENDLNAIQEYLNELVTNAEIRQAVLMCWQHLQAKGTVHKRSFTEVYERKPGPFDSVEVWWDAVRPIFDKLPGVNPPENNASFYRFKY